MTLAQPLTRHPLLAQLLNPASSAFSPPLSRDPPDPPTFTFQSETLPLWDATPTIQHVAVLISLVILATLFAHHDDYLTSGDTEMSYRMPPN